MTAHRDIADEPAILVIQPSQGWTALGLAELWR